VYPKEGNRDILEQYGVSQHKWALHAGASTATIRHVVHPGSVPVYGRDGVTKWKRRGNTPETAHRLASAFAELAGIEPQEAYDLLFDDIDRQTSLASKLKDISAQLRASGLDDESDLIDIVVRKLVGQN
jgi:hypothetical protein